MKYVILKKKEVYIPIVFSDTLVHADAAKSVPGSTVVSAGVVGFKNSGIVAGGDIAEAFRGSASLKINIGTKVENYRDSQFLNSWFTFGESILILAGGTIYRT